MSLFSPDKKTDATLLIRGHLRNLKDYWDEDLDGYRNQMKMVMIAGVVVFATGFIVGFIFGHIR